MEFKYFRETLDEIEEPGSELENMMESEITIFEEDPMIEEIPDYHILNDDFMQEEPDRLEQEDLDEMLKPKIP